MSRTAITLKLKMCPLLDEACSCAEKLLIDINLPSLMPDEDNNFGGSLVSDFRKWWRHVQPKNMFLSSRLYVTDCEKRMKFNLLHFPNKVGYRAGNMQADISQNVFYPKKIKLQNSASAPVCKSCKLIQLVSKPKIAFTTETKPA